MDAPVHLLLADPNEEKRTLLAAWLKRQGFLVSAARDADHGARLMEGLAFDLIVADTQAGITPGDTPVLWLVPEGSGHPGDTLNAPFDPPALVTRINEVLDRTPAPTPKKPETLKLGPLTYHVEQARLTKGDERITLTSTEVKLMRALAQRPAAPITRAELADEVGADPMSRAVDVQITRLRRKLEADQKNPRFLQTVRGTGYMLSPD